MRTGEHKSNRGDVLLTIVGTIGRAAVVPEDISCFTVQRSVAVLKTYNTLNSRFLMYHLLFLTDYLKNKSRGVAQKGIYLGQLKELEILFPPLPEQERIVGVLDEAFEGIATATGQAEKNLQNARELFQSVLQSTFSQKGMIGWRRLLGALPMSPWGKVQKEAVITM